MEQSGQVDGPYKINAVPLKRHIITQWNRRGMVVGTLCKKRQRKGSVWREPRVAENICI
jgi:hypothetical protein